jgi:drug/metabolite transporter (DMT)-like permease
MVLGIGALTSMDALAKSLVQQGFNPMQILGLRFFIIIPSIIAYYVLTGRLRKLLPTRAKFQIVRGCIGFCAPFSFFLSLKYLPLSDAIITSYSSIMMITALSHFVLKEKVGIHRWGAVVVGFVGVYIAISPSGEGRLFGYILVLIAALSYAILMISGRVLARTESVGSLVFVFNFCVGLIALCFTPLVWQPLSTVAVLMIVALGFLALVGHFCLVLAVSRSQTSVIAPFEYTSIVWAVIIEWTIWQYLPAQRTTIGGLIIICAGIYVIYRESLRSRAQRKE